MKPLRTALSLLLCAALLLIPAPARAVDLLASAPVFRVSAASAAPGEEVELALQMENNPGIIAANLELNYDRDKLELVAVTDAKLLPNGIFADQLSTYPYVLFWEASTASGDITASGTLATLRFKVKESCPAGQTAEVWVSYDPDNVYNYSLDNVAFTCVKGGVTAASAQEDFAVTVENRTGGLAAVSLASGRCSGSRSFTVTCDRACVVLVKSGGGCTALTGSGTGGSRGFTLNVTGDLTLIVALKGDVDGARGVTVADASLVNRSLLTPGLRAYRALSDEEALIADVDGSGAVELDDASSICRSILSTSARAFKALSW